MIVKMSGGLGNQLFQWATFYALSKKKHAPYLLDLSHYEHNGSHGGFRLPLLQLVELPIRKHTKSSSSCDLFEKIIYSLCLHWPRMSYFFKNYIHEGFVVNNNIPVIHNGIYMGFWQSHEYFSSYFDELKQMVVPHNISPRVRSLLKRMSQETVLSVHVRKGDYVTNIKANQTHGICSLAFYKKALAYMRDTANDIDSVFVFSDDIGQARKELSHELSLFSRVEFIEGNSQEEDLYLMSKAHHHVIANSSFSWWGAWLGQHQGQVVVSPYPWYNIEPKYSSDPSLSTWIRMDK